MRGIQRFELSSSIVARLGVASRQEAMLKMQCQSPV
jgi:hypothetical protein